MLSVTCCAASFPSAISCSVETSESWRFPVTGLRAQAATAARRTAAARTFIGRLQILSTDGPREASRAPPDLGLRWHAGHAREGHSVRMPAGAAARLHGT